MNFRVYILAISTVAVGLVELIVVGILPRIAEDLHISIGTAGQLVTVYAFMYAVTGPILLVLTSRMERKRLYLLSMFIFFIGNIMTYFSPNFLIMIIFRVITAMSTALIVALSITIATKIVHADHRAKALGLVYMGISSSIILGVPLGILISDTFGWRFVFLCIGLITIGAMILDALFLERIPGEKAVPLIDQLKAIGHPKIISAHFATMFMLAGFYTLYSYFTPFLEATLHLSTTWITICYFIFGIASVSGGAFGGILSDRIGAKKSIIIVISTFALSMILLPFTTFSLILFIPMMIIWGGISWALSPPQQSYLIESAPRTSDIQQSFNASALQVGISLGSFVGGITVEKTDSVSSLSWIGTGIVLISLFCAIFSLTRPMMDEKVRSV